MEIVNKYETAYKVTVIDPTAFPPSSYIRELKAKRIVITETDITFFDYYNCVSGYFDKRYVVDYVKDRN